MSLTSGPINEVEQAGEKFADHVGKAMPATVASVLSTVLPALAEYDLVIRVRLEKR